MTLERAVDETFALTWRVFAEVCVVKGCVGLNGEGALVGAARGTEMFPLVVDARFCVGGEPTSLRGPICALVLTLARGRGPGVGEDDVGSLLSGEGGRERSNSALGVTWRDGLQLVDTRGGGETDLGFNRAIHGTLHACGEEMEVVKR